MPRDERSTFFASALSAFVAFATIGLLAGLAALFLAVTPHHPSHALAGAVVGAMFAAAVAAQIVTVTFVGISLPVVGAGITLSRHVSPKVTILGFARGDERPTSPRFARRQARSPRR